MISCQSASISKLSTLSGSLAREVVPATNIPIKIFSSLVQCLRASISFAIFSSKVVHTISLSTKYCLAVSIISCAFTEEITTYGALKSSLSTIAHDTKPFIAGERSFLPWTVSSTIFKFSFNIYPPQTKLTLQTCT